MIRKILIISLAGIGDFIMATPTIRALRKAYPKAKIDLLTFPKGTKDVVEGSEYIDNIFLYYDRKNTMTRKKPSRLKTLKNSLFPLLELRRKNYDVSISVFPSASNKLALLAKIIGAKKRIGFGSKHYTHPINWDYKNHKIDQNIRLLEPLGIKVKDKKQFFHIFEENRKFAKEFLKQNKKDQRALIGMHPGSWWKATLKNWPLENYIELANKLIIKHNANILVVCGPSEEHIGEKIKNSVEKKDKVIVLEKQTLKNSAAIIAHCDAFVTSDSGVMHVAEVMEVPIILIPGYTLFKFSGVYKPENKKNIVWENLNCYEKCPVMWKFEEEFEGRENKIPCGIECYRNIKPEKVLKVVQKIIKKSGRK